MPFRYLRDPLFLATVAMYFVNRFVLKKVWPSGFCHEHFNDLICIPFWAPVVVWLCRKIGTRRDDRTPQPYELLVMLISWSILFELVLPRHPFWSQWAHADHLDVLCYTAGALAASVFWQMWYREGGQSDRIAAPPAGARSGAEASQQP